MTLVHCQQPSGIPRGHARDGIGGIAADVGSSATGLAVVGATGIIVTVSSCVGRFASRMLILGSLVRGQIRAPKGYSRLAVPPLACHRSISTGSNRTYRPIRIDGSSPRRASE